MADDHVQVAVVVEVSDGQTVADVIALEVGASAGVCEPESLAREVSIQQRGLGVARRLAEKPGVIVDVAIGDHDIGPAVGVEIGQGQPQPIQGRLSTARPKMAVTSRKEPARGSCRACCIPPESW